MPTPYKKHVLEQNGKEDSSPGQEITQSLHRASPKEPSGHDHTGSTRTREPDTCQHLEKLCTFSSEYPPPASSQAGGRTEKDYHTNTDLYIEKSDEKLLRSSLEPSSSDLSSLPTSSTSESAPLLPHSTGKPRWTLTVNPAHSSVDGISEY